MILAEWAFTVVFAIEYGLRLWSIQNRWAYARSFYGVVDLMGILPMLISLWIDGSQYFLVVRVLRVLRVFRVLRMVRWAMETLAASRRKITVFICSVMALMVVFLMYLVEGGHNPEFMSVFTGQ